MRIDQVTSSYAGIRKEIDTWFKHMYDRVLALAQVVGSAETFPRICSRQQHRNNLPAESALYWKCTVVISFFYIACKEIRCCYSPQKRAHHYDLCIVMAETLMTKTEKCPRNGAIWYHLHLLWRVSLCTGRTYEEHSHQQLKASMVHLHWPSIWAMFFPNIRELLKVLEVLPLGIESERSFHCVRRVHTWLWSTMTMERLSNLAVISMNGHAVLGWKSVGILWLCNNEE